MSFPGNKCLEKLQSLSATPEEVAIAVHELAYIAKQNNSRIRALETSIPLLINVAKSEHLKCKTAAVRTLQVFAEEHKEWKQEIIKQGAIAVFIENLKEADLYGGHVVAEAAKALWKLSTNDTQVQEEATRLGCMPILVHLLLHTRPSRPGGKEVQRWTVAALHALTLHSEAARLAAVEAGAIQAVVELHSDGCSQDVRTWALDVSNSLKPLVNSDGTAGALCKSRYQCFGPLGAVQDYKGERLYCL
mmetsp:Transcript_12919/g.17668  ORF Transcript_12919/g.17668 Transcript_12919/m.17668 type:complete len:247 (-) Transcript_12919:189-929(-)